MNNMRRLAVLGTVCGLVLATTAIASDYPDWTFTDVDTTVTASYARNAIAIDPAGVPHIVYMDVAEQDIRYATRPGAAWQVEVVEDGTAVDDANVTARPGLALDNLGRPRALYWATRGADKTLVFAARDGGAWTYESVASSTSPLADCRLEIGVDGVPVIAYAVWNGSRMDLHYGARTGGVWTDAVIGEGDEPALGFDATGRPRVLYRGWNGAAVISLRLAVFTEGSWTTEALTYPGNWPELAFDVAGAAHITYKGGSYVRYATNASGTWVDTPIAQTLVDARGAPLGFDSAGQPVIAYPDTGHRLRWAYRLGGSWVSEYPTDEFGNTVWGVTPSLAFDRHRFPCLAFRGARGLRFGRGVDSWLDCRAAPTLPCPGIATGSTAGLPDFVETYGCDGAAETCGEQTWVFDLDGPRQVTITATPATGVDLDLFLLSACGAYACETSGHGVVSALLTPGTWYLVVDGPAGAAGAYSLTTACATVGIDWCNLAGPATLWSRPGEASAPVYGRVRVGDQSALPGATTGLVAQVGLGVPGTDPWDPSPDFWTWAPVTFARDVDGADEFSGSVTGWDYGIYDICFRYSYWGGAWVYGDRDGSGNGYAPAQAGKLVVSESTAVPDPAGALTLFPVAPNPFNPRTTIRFDLPRADRVRLAVYDVRGQLVRELLEADLAAGAHAVAWDGHDDRGAAVPSGSYVARLLGGGAMATTRLQLIR